MGQQAKKTVEATASKTQRAEIELHGSEAEGECEFDAILSVVYIASNENQLAPVYVRVCKTIRPNRGRILISLIYFP
ncbi:hypothetical protein ANCCAN_06493 [Ancylostoma caninum]|uniref:Uncharacterized protein n=1 Tax=Ancylostoma caninum TaxID=29170 RepID=A0A368GSV1_ANCCA|nr:hypothetical protein ANCCAN_06493 [Ancylostoma caninum]